MKLFKVLIKSYHFGIVHYDLFVLAEDEEAMYQTVYNHPLYKKMKMQKLKHGKKLI